jgi:hypothetical protein
MYFRTFFNNSQFKHWLGKSKHEPYALNAMAVTIKHQDNLQAEVSYQSSNNKKKTKKTTTTTTTTNETNAINDDNNNDHNDHLERQRIKHQEDPYPPEIHLMHAVRPLVGASATGK